MAVGIRAWRPEDASVIVEALNDPGVTDNLRDGLPKPYTEADALEYIAAMQDEGRLRFRHHRGRYCGRQHTVEPAEKYSQPHGGAGLLCGATPLGPGHRHRGAAAYVQLRV